MKGQQMLSGLQNLTLNVIKMEGYKRGILWSDTNLPWISPSPNIVDLDTAILYHSFFRFMHILAIYLISFDVDVTYPGTGFFEAFNLVTEGRGTLMPFKLIGGDWVNSTVLVQQLQSYNLPGMRNHNIIPSCSRIN